jgi:hypothetical protein
MAMCMQAPDMSDARAGQALYHPCCNCIAEAVQAASLYLPFVLTLMSLLPFCPSAVLLPAGLSGRHAVPGQCLHSGNGSQACTG